MLELDFLKIEHNNVAPKKGKVLISEPFTRDSFFKRSVVLLTEHNENGTIGFILNKTVDIRISELISGFPDFRYKISLGGPVQTNTIHYIHTLENIPSSVNIMKDVYWGGDIEHIKLIAETGILQADQIRFFIGYSGWAPKQLDNELSRNYWIVGELDKQTIFNAPPDSAWKEILSNMEEKYRIWTTFPENYDMN
ncbi:MAG: YqgE/AlgH family protein [Bacteroidia bacterium]|nr:YqgE/AlgH family protein [Bacteroidia bacterium]